MKRLNLGVVKFVPLYENVKKPYFLCWAKDWHKTNRHEWAAVAAIPPFSFFIWLAAKFTGHWYE